MYNNYNIIPDYIFVKKTIERLYKYKKQTLEYRNYRTSGNNIIIDYKDFLNIYTKRYKLIVDRH
jgi:hypothetical protein